MQAVILAGGKGTRLSPYTTIIPKPLMPIGDIPILELVLTQLKYYGFKDVIITVGHLANVIMAVFGDGNKLGLNIRYFIEDKPLGTAGSLAFLDDLEDDFLVLNGDLLTTLDFSKLIGFHTKKGAQATVSIYERKVKIDFGVVEFSNNMEMKEYKEKPSFDFYVSMGINCINKKVLVFMEKGEYLDMPDLMKRLVNSNQKILCFKDNCYWLDIGRIEDYNVAVKEFSENRELFLKLHKGVK